MHRRHPIFVANQQSIQEHGTFQATWCIENYSRFAQGFFWFQGWNDQYGAENEYRSNMEHFIRDVRKDLRLPKLPFVVAAMGQNGSKEAKGAMLTIRDAQLAMQEVPEFKGNVRAFRTDVLVDKAAEALYPNWQKDVEKWKLVGGDHGYHYLGSAIWFTRIGHAAGEAMKELLK